MIKNMLLLLVMLGSFGLAAQTSHLFLEAESFSDQGGWVTDPQFVEQMGSPYLLAHGLGVPVRDAETTLTVEKPGRYHVWARTMNWVPGKWEAPGKFQVLVNGRKLPVTLGINPGWNWEYAGSIQLDKGASNIRLRDLTGFEGRCDAIYFSTDKKDVPPAGKQPLREWREKMTGAPEAPAITRQFDLVVVGGGIAGCAAAMTAAEQGMKVALVHDRPVLGGNASSEIRVHTEGIYGKFERILRKIDTGAYPNGSAEAANDDKKRMDNISGYKDIVLFLNYRAYRASAGNGKISSVDARHTSTGETVRLEAPLFVDCTGDGWIGYWAGAEYSYGREASSKYNEAWEEKGPVWSPETPDNLVMGSSVLWGTENAGKPVTFPEVPWAMEVAKNYADYRGEWQWEFSRNDLNQVDDAETIRDHMLRAIYGSFYNFKNTRMQQKTTDKGTVGNVETTRQQQKADSLKLKWVSYLVGKRESRRLVGDYIYTFNDEKNATEFEDAVVFEKRSVDVHFQTSLVDPSKPDFKSEAMFYKTKQYNIPYRCLYSKNISNLFMAGRNFSCSHLGLGGPRVMRTTGQMGGAVGIAAALCKKYQASPREIYQDHLKEYLKLIESQK